MLFCLLKIKLKLKELCKVAQGLKLIQISCALLQRASAVQTIVRTSVSDWSVGIDWLAYPNYRSLIGRAKKIKY